MYVFVQNNPPQPVASKKSAIIVADDVMVLAVVGVDGFNTSELGTT
jgi:hypothetical protein